MEPLAIQAALASLKVATDISKSILDFKAGGEIQGKVIELQGALMEAQTAAISATTAQFELQERIRALEEELRAANDWGGQECRYVLVCPWGGPAQVYALKRSASEGEEPHFLCSHCFHDRKRVILNPGKRGSWVIMVCPSCKASVDTDYRGIGSPKYAEEYAKDSEG